MYSYSQIRITLPLPPSLHTLGGAPAAQASLPVTACRSRTLGFTFFLSLYSRHQSVLHLCGAKPFPPSALFEYKGVDLWTPLLHARNRKFLAQFSKDGRIHCLQWGGPLLTNSLKIFIFQCQQCGSIKRDRQKDTFTFINSSSLSTSKRNHFPFSHQQHSHSLSSSFSIMMSSKSSISS